jgi:hypothetical protein
MEDAEQITVETETAEAPAPAAERLPVETWAERRGYLPLMIQPQRAPQVSGMPGDKGAVVVNMLQAGVVGPSVNPEAWKFAAAKAMHRWPIGWAVTEAEFDQAVTDATDGVVIR